MADWCEVHKLDEKHDLILTSHIWREWNGLGKTGLEIEVEEWTGHATTTCRVWQHGEVIHEECSDADSVRTAKYRAVELRRTLTIARLVVEAGCLTEVSTREYTIPVYWRQDLDTIIEDNTEEDEDDKLPGSETHAIIEVWRKVKP